jgi:hypothetical protein
MWLTTPLSSTLLANFVKRFLLKKDHLSMVAGHFQISQQNKNVAPRTPSISASRVLIYFNEVNKLMSLQRKVQGQSAGPQAQRISP